MNELMPSLTDLGDSPWSPSISFFFVDMLWRFHTSILQLSASWSIYLPEPIYLSNAALLRIRPNNFYRSTSPSLTSIIASARTPRRLGSPVPLSPSNRSNRRHLHLQIHYYLLIRHFRSHPQQSDLRTIFRYPQVRMPASTVGCLLSGKALS
jgi:hypothetical protein